ncbi:hypothetical protein J2Y03_002004 [Neobacillus niacini]|nr:hypothetical protein [Neobacillus niacini]MDR7076981.1 hypothetical protein [Neobacillus niacini]
MTEEHIEKAFGSMQEAWSDRRDVEKSFGSMQEAWSDRRAANLQVPHF